MTREMREPTFVILTSLVDGPRHGYAVIADVLDLSGGTLRLQPGTLYAALDRLRVDGFVSIDREEVTRGRLRRYYALTDDGLQALQVEAERRSATTARALSRLRAAGQVRPS